MGGGTVFRGIARVMGAATVGAAVPTTGGLCHVHLPASDLSREQENLSAEHSQKEVFDMSANGKEFASCAKVQFEQEGSRFKEKKEGNNAASLRQTVFSSPPTEEEVEEATNELHAALHLSFLAQTFAPEESSSDSTVGLPSDEDGMDITPPYKRETSTSSQSITQLGKFAVEAFQLIQTNSRVQDAVKSLARDPAVWNAVMSNQKVLELTQEDVEEMQESFDSDDEYHDEIDEASVITFASKLYGFVTTSTRVYYSYVTGMLFSVLQSMFGSMEKTLLTKGSTSAKDKTVASCMMLAVAVVIVVVVRRSFRRH